MKESMAAVDGPLFVDLEYREYLHSRDKCQILETQLTIPQGLLADIADAVWKYEVRKKAGDELVLIRQVLTNPMEIKEGELIFYDDEHKARIKIWSITGAGPAKRGKPTDV